MDWFLEFINSQAGLIASGAIITFLWGWFSKYKPKWSKFLDGHRGTIIKGVKWAKKQDPGGGNGEKRLQLALQFILGNIDERPKKEVVEEAIEVVLDEHERGVADA